MSSGQGDQSGDQGPQLDGMDSAAMQQETMDVASNIGGMGLINDGPQELSQSMRAIKDIEDRAQKKAELAKAVEAGGHMVVDPDKVDGLAAFFRIEAKRLRDRRDVVADLAMVEPPGSDPTSQGVAEVFSRVGAGDGDGYLENYLKLADVFDQTAEELEASAKQTRTDEQNAEDAFRGGDLA